MRHNANIMRPADSLDASGGRQGDPTVFIRDWQFSYKQLSGTLQDQVNGTWGNAAGQLEGYADPDKVVTPGFFLTGGSLGTRRLTIVNAEDVGGIGRRLILTYQEVTE